MLSLFVALAPVVPIWSILARLVTYLVREKRLHVLFELIGGCPLVGAILSEVHGMIQLIYGFGRWGAVAADFLRRSYSRPWWYCRRCVCLVYWFTRWWCKLVVTLVRTTSNWLWGATAAGRRDRRVATPAPSADTLPSLPGGFAKASWSIINEAAVACRCQLGLDRYTTHDDLATRQLVAKTCYGILTDRERFPDLRRADADRLVIVAREVALSPSSDELVALNICSSAPMARNRSLARGEWGWQPSTWYEWMLSFLGYGRADVYLSALSSPSPGF